MLGESVMNSNGYDSRRTWRQQLRRKLYRLKQRAKSRGRAPDPSRVAFLENRIRETRRV